MDHLSWLGLHKDLSGSTSLRPFWDKSVTPHKSEEQVKELIEKVEKLGSVRHTSTSCLVFCCCETHIGSPVICIDL